MYIYGIILKYTAGCMSFGVLWWCCVLRCVVLCTHVVAPLTGLSCVVRNVSCLCVVLDDPGTLSRLERRSGVQVATIS